jgi:hypothetical protein
MKAKDIVAHLNTQLGQSRSALEKEVVVRIGGQDYAIRGIDASTAAVILEGGAEVTHEDTLSGGSFEGPGGPEGEGVEPPPPEIGQAIMASDPATQEKQSNSRKASRPR